MSKTLKVTYSLTLEMPSDIEGRSAWKKIGVEEQPEKGETREALWDKIDNEARAWYKKKHPELYDKEERKPKIIYTESDYDVHEDLEWEEIKLKLSSIEFREEAQEYIGTTSYHMALEAKKLINQKPLKNKQ